MTIDELRAELSIRMLDLEKAIDLGMPYQDLKNIYNSIKELQFLITSAETKRPRRAEPESNEYVIE